MARIELVNSATVQAYLLAIPREIRRKVEREALTEAGKFAVGQLKENAPSETGALKKSLAYDIRQYKGGNVLATLVGAKNDYVGTVQQNKKGKKVFKRNADASQQNRRPAKYYHLVNLGTKERTTKDGKNRGSVPATNFREKTMQEIAARVQQILENAVYKACDLPF